MGREQGVPKVSSVIVPYACYLRVYEPLAAFQEPERRHWERYARRPDRPSYQDELRRSLADLVPTPPVPVPVHESSDAFVTEIDGALCVCPWRTRLRGWQALEGLSHELPAPVLDAVLPPVVRTLKEAIDEGPLIEGLVDVGRWLEEFHPRSLVELDYGGLVHVLSAAELDEDHSAADVAEGIEALRLGDADAAGEAYGRLAGRWRAVRDRRSAN